MLINAVCSLGFLKRIKPTGNDFNECFSQSSQGLVCFSYHFKCMGAKLIIINSKWQGFRAWFSVKFGL